ncbi:MAG: HEAT repeat domain-containing protein [Planctomycetota bacterium]|nr:HEAT repeat domain-containing protein [Planctomycetota bacterium]
MQSTGLFLAGALCVCGLAVQAQEPSVEAQAKAWLLKYPYWHTGPYAPSISLAERNTARNARAFARAHPEVTLGAAQGLMAGEPERRQVLLEALAFYGCPEFETFFLQCLPKDAKADDYAKKMEANTCIEFLGRIHSTHALEPLGKLLVEGDQNLIMHTLSALLEINDPRAAPSMLAYLVRQDAYYGYKCFAIRALGAWKHVPALEPLVNQLESDKSEEVVRKAAAQALVTIGSPQAVPALARICRQKEGAPEAFRALLELDPAHAAAHALDLRGMSMVSYLDANDALPYLRNVFANGKPEERLQAARGLIERGDRSAVPWLKQELWDGLCGGGLEDEKLSLLFAAGEAEAWDLCLWLRQCCRYQLADPMAEHAGFDRLPYVRKAFVRQPIAAWFQALSRLAGRLTPDEEKNLAVLAAQGEEARRAMLVYGTRERVPEIREVARTVLEERHTQLLPYALEYLVVMPDAKQEGLLWKLLETSYEAHAPMKRIAEALIQVADARTRFRCDALIRKRIESRNAFWAAYVLFHAGDEADRSRIVECMERELNPDVPLVRDDLSPPEDEANARRGWAVELAEALKLPELLPALRAGAETTLDQDLRLKYARALALQGDAEQRRACEAVLAEEHARPEAVIFALQALHDSSKVEAVELLQIEFLAREGNPDVRRAALRVLRDLGDEGSLNAVERLPLARRLDALDEWREACKALRERCGLDPKGSPAVAAAPRMFEGPLHPTPALRDALFEAFAECLRKHEFNLLLADQVAFTGDSRAIPLLIKTAQAPMLWAGCHSDALRALRELFSLRGTGT